MSKKTLHFLIPLSILFALAVPQIAQASLIPGPFDVFDAISGTIEELAGPVAGILIKIFLYYILGLICLGVSKELLEMAMDPSWLSIQGSPIVENGWRFTVNIANMFIVVSLVFIALAIILKLSSFQSKKVLTRLIIAAFLINFSLVFVGMLVDVSNIFYKTLWEGNQSLPTNITESIGASGSGVLGDLIVWLMALGVSFGIPMVGAPAQVALITIVLGVGFLSNIVTWVFQLVCFFLVSAIFFFYAVLFAIRVFVIQLLAILSPLAVVAWIFPQTKKYAQIWFRFLLQWVFLGIFLFFFLAIGMASAEALMPKAGAVPIPFYSFPDVGEYFVYYLFLSIYLAIAAVISIKGAPAAAQQAIGMAKGGGKMIVTRGLKPIWKRFRRGASRFAARTKAEEEEYEEEGRKPPLAKQLSHKMGGVARWGHRVAGTTPEVLLERDVAEKKKDLQKRFGKDVESAKAYFGKWLGKKGMTDTDKMAFTEYAAETKGAKGLSKLTDKELLEAAELIAKNRAKRLKRVAKHRPDLIDKSDLIKSRMVPKKEEDKDVKQLIKLGFSKAEAIEKAAFKKAVDDLRTKDVENLSRETVDDPNFQEMTARFKPFHFWRKIGDEIGGKSVLNIQEKAEEIGLEEIKKSNPQVLKAPYTPGGAIYLRRWEMPPEFEEEEKGGVSPYR